MLDKSQILAYLAEIKPQLQSDGIIKLGLFGSFAKDKADTFSDVDIVLQSSDKLIQKCGGGLHAFIYLDELREKLARNFKREVDICDIASMPPKRQNQILTGVIYV